MPSKKYESGDVVVSHAVMSALLLLGRDPSGLSVLKQRVRRKEAAYRPPAIAFPQFPTATFRRLTACLDALR